jgi:hypothetical protein
MYRVLPLTGSVFRDIIGTGDQFFFKLSRPMSEHYHL